MRIAIGCDHIVTDIKDKIKASLEAKGHMVIDEGTYDFARTHYPIYGQKVAEAVTSRQADLGVVLCGTGVGITNAANKVPGARVALVADVSAAKYAKEELNANIIGVGGRVVGLGTIEDIVETFISSSYHPNDVNRDMIAKIDGLVKEETEDAATLFQEFLDKWDKGEYHDE